MAEKTIGIRIKLNGLNTVVKDIGTLEKELKLAKEDLKQLEIGSDLFKQLSSEIAVAERQLQGLNKSAEALNTEKVVEGFSKLGGGISSAFAAATAAVNLFGADSEEASKAAADAQNLLTIALSIRGAAEIRTGAQIVAKTIAERAATAATTAANTATKVFYTTLATNPYTAIIAAVGLLVAAYFSLKTETEETAKEQKTLNELYDESLGAVQGQILQIRTLQTVVNDTNSSYEEQIGAYQQLQKLVPELSNLTLEQARAQGVLNSAIEEEINLIQLRAEQKALEDFLVELKKQEIQQERLKRQREETKKQLDELTKLQEDFARAAAGGFAGTFEEFEKQQKSFQGLGQTTDDVTGKTKRLSVEEERLLEVTGKISEITGKRKINTDNLSTSQNTLNQFVTKSISKFKELGQVLAFNYGEPKILADLREIDKELKRLTEGPDSFDEKVKKTFTKGATDIFGVAYDQYRERLSSAVLKGGDELGKEIATITSEAAKKVQTGEFSIDAFVALQSLTKEYSNLQKLITESPEITKSLGDLKYYDNLKGQLIQTGQIIFEEVNGNIQLLDTTSEQYIKSLTDGTKNFQSVEKQLSDQIFNSLMATGKYTKEQAEELTKTRVEGIRNLSTAIVTQEEKIRGILFETQKVSNKIQSNLGKDTEAFRNFIVENVDLLTEKYKKIGLENKKFFSDDELNRKEQTDLNKALLDRQLQDYQGYFQQRKIDANDLAQVDILLAQEGIDLEKYTAEEKIKIYEAFYNKIKQFRDENTTDEKDSAKETLDEISKVIGYVQQTLGRAASVSAQYFQFQLQKLEDSYQSSMDMIVGDTETANKKRTELEEQYQKQKAEIEKRAAIRALQFQLAQAIADGASAVIQVAAVPPLAIAVGLIAAAQIAIIAQQLSYAQSLAGGGLIKGASHEMGGVFAGGGMNLEGGEAVLNRQTSMDYLPLLSTLNQMGGGQPIVNNGTGTLQEERILQAIATQKSQPIRAYVLGSEITNSQAINKRLDELSTL